MRIREKEGRMEIRGENALKNHEKKNEKKEKQKDKQEERKNPKWGSLHY
jgi:hypothetical protein